MAAPPSPVGGTRRRTFTPRALLGPPGSRGDWQHPDDPLHLDQRKPAHVGAVLVTGSPDPPAQPARQPAPLRRVVARLVDLLALGVATVALLVAAAVQPLSPAEATRAVRVVAAARPDVGAPPGGWPQRIFDAV